MNKNEYLSSLKQELDSMPDAEKNEILRDQEEYINEAIKSGRAENNVVEALGSPKELAQELRAHFQINKASDEKKIIPKLRSTLDAVLALCILAPFNLIFVLGPFCGFIGFLLAVWGAAFALFLSGLAASLFSFLFIPQFIFFITMFFGSLAIAGLGALGLLGSYEFTKWFLKLALSYLRWNIKFISGESNEK